MKLSSFGLILLVLLMFFILIGGVCAMDPLLSEENNVSISSSFNSVSDNCSDANFLSSSVQLESGNVNFLSSDEEKINLETIYSVDQLGSSPIDGVYYVNNNSTSNPDGSYDKPFGNITSALTSITSDSWTGNYTINIAPGTYTENSISLPGDKNITFQRTPSETGEVIINGAQNQIFTTLNTKNDINFNYINLTLTNAKTTNNGAVINLEGKGNIGIFNCKIKNNTATSNGGAIFTIYGNVTVTDSEFINNTAKYSGGAILANSGNVNVTGSEFINNTAGDKGGAIYTYHGNVTVTNSEFINNAAYEGGAIYTDSGNVSVTGSEFINNSATKGNGGAILANYGNVSVTGSEFINNSATTDYGGAIYTSSNVTVTNSKFINNSAPTSGGAIYTSGNVTVAGSEFINNSATTNGGAIYTRSGNVTVTGSEFINNTANQYGGAIYTDSGNVTVTGSEFINNSATKGNGGAILANYGNVSVTGSEFINNSATTDYGGAISTGYGNVSVTNSKFINNTAKYGGAISTGYGNVSVTGSEFINNTATTNGGAICAGYCGVSVTGSVLVNNTAKTGSAIYANFIGDVTGNWWGNNTPFSDGNKLIFNSTGPSYVIPSDFVIVNVISSGSDFKVEFLNSSGKALTNFIPSRPITLNSSTIGVSINPSTGNITNNKFTSTVNAPLGSSNIVTLTVDNEVQDITVLSNIVYVNCSQTGTGTGTITDPFKNITNAVNTIYGGSITDYIINIAPGTYTENSISLPGNKNITFQRTLGETGEVIINGAQNQIFTTLNTENDINFNYINLTLTNAKTTNNGSVINLQGKGNIKISNCKIKNNTAKDSGGAILTNYGNVTVTNSEFINNTATNKWGGAISTNYGNVNVTGSEFINNTATSNAGAIRTNFGNVSVTGSEFLNNTAKSGGAIGTARGNVNVTGSEFVNNIASTEQGGAICKGYGNVSVTDSEFINNTATSGGAIFTYSGNVTVTNSEFLNNTATSGGGAILTNYGNVSVTGSVFVNNTAKFKGGAIWAKFIGDVTGNWWGNNTPNGNNLVYGEDVGDYVIPSYLYMVLSKNGDLVIVSLKLYNYESGVVSGFTGLPSRNVIFSSSTGSMDPIINSTDIDGVSTSTYTHTSSGEVYYINSTIDNQVLISSNIIQTSINASLSTSNLVYGEDENLTITLYDNNGNPLPNQNIIVKVNQGTETTYKTNSTGNVLINLKNYSAGNYIITYNFTSTGLYLNSTNTTKITINKQSTIINTTQSEYVFTFKESGHTVVVNLFSKDGEVLTNFKFGYNITSEDNKTVFDEGESTNGVINIPTNLAGGKYYIHYKFTGNENYTGSVNSTGLVISKQSTIVNCSSGSYSFVVGSTGNSVSVFLFDKNGISLTGKVINYTINNMNYSTSNGVILIPDGLSVDTYTLSFNFTGDVNYTGSFNSTQINIISNPVPPVSPIGTVLIGEDLTTNNTSINFTVTLKTVDGTVLSDENILYILYDEYYPVTTDKDGFATVTLDNLSVGVYSIRYVYNGNSLYASSNGESVISIVNNTKADSNLKTYYVDNVLSFNLTCEGQPLPNQSINVTINGTSSILITDKNGLTHMSLNNYSNGNYTVNYNYPGNNDVNGVNGTLNITISNLTNVSTVLTINNFTEFYGEGLNLTGKLTNMNNVPIVGEHICINLSNPQNGLSKIYWTTTDTQGEYQLQINLYSGEYIASASYGGSSTYLSSGPVNASILVNKTGTVLSADKFNETFNAGSNFTGKLVNTLGKPIIGQHICLNLSNPRNGLSKIYWVTTDTQGEYQLAINLYTGEYLAYCSYFGTSQYEPSKVNTTITVNS